MSTSNNTTADQQIAQLKKQIADGAESTKSYLTSLQGKVSDYDKEHQLSDTASSYLQAGIDKANWSVDELKDFGARFQDGSKELSDEILTTGKSALANVQSSLDSIKSKASEYDAKARKTASNASNEASKEASNAKSSLSDLVESARDQGNSWFDSISTSFENLQKQISANATAASNAASDAAQATTDKVAETDKNVTGGVGADLYNKTADLVSQGVDYVSSAFQSTPADKTATSMKP